MDKLLQYDESLLLFLNGLGDTSWDGFWIIVTHKYTFIPLYALLLFWVYREKGIKGLLLVAVVSALMITCTDQLSSWFKSSFERPRPCRVPHLEEVLRSVAVRCGKYGFFSAHAASSMALAVFTGLLLKKHYPYLIFFMLFWSIWVSYSRIYLGVHYPLDIIVGMVFGALIGWLAYRLEAFLVKKLLPQKNT